MNSVDEAAVEITKRIDAASLDLLAAVIADPKRGVPVAEETGIVQFSFEDDHRILWIAADVGRQLDRDAWKSFARAALRQHFFWDDCGSIARWGAMQWNDATLNKLASLYPYLDGNVQLHGRRLIELFRIRRDASEHLEFARRLMAGEVR